VLPCAAATRDAARSRATAACSSSWAARIRITSGIHQRSSRACPPHQLRGDATGLVDTVGELCELCERYQFAYYREWALVLAGRSRMDEAGIELAGSWPRQEAGIRAVGTLAAQSCCG
jgi:hypothetical protein